MFKNRKIERKYSLSNEIRLRIILCHDKGILYNQIYQRWTIYHNIVPWAIQRRNERGCVESRTLSGRPRMTNNNQDRYIVQMVVKNRWIFVSSFKKQK